MLNGAAACASAACSTITQTLNLADQGVRSVILGATPPYLAAVVLALTILRQPARRLARADLELLNLATEQLEDYFSRWVPNREFIRGGALLREQLNIALNQYGGNESRTRARSSRLMPNRYGEGLVPDDTITAGGIQDNVDDWPEELFEGLQFDELWDIMGSDCLMGNDQFPVA
jgi:hypothetical protein